MVVGNRIQPGKSTGLKIFPHAQSEREEITRFWSLEAVQAVMYDLPGLNHVIVDTAKEDDRTVHSQLLKFGSKRQAQEARQRIIEEHTGGDWPPFGVAFAAPESLSFGGPGCGAV